MFHGGDYSRWHHLLRKLMHHHLQFSRHGHAHGQSNELNLTIGVLGGSMAAGHIDLGFAKPKKYESYCEEQCESKYPPEVNKIASCQKCTYIQRFRYWLERAYPHVNVRVKNYAVPATTSQSILSLLGPEFYQEHLDVVFVSIHCSDIDSLLNKSILLHYRFNMVIMIVIMVKEIQM